jgi:hypothetical protein
MVLAVLETAQTAHQTNKNRASNKQKMAVFV